VPKPANEMLEKYKNGELKFRELFGFDAKQAAALLVVGHNLYTQGRFEDAKNIFEGLTVLDDSNPYVHGILGSIYQKQRKYDLALARYTLALNLFPDDISSLLNRGEVYLKLGKFLEAAEDFKKAIALDPAQENPAANRARLMVALTQDALKLAKEKGLDAVIEEKNRVGREVSKIST
jgi:tetratricopeptide (TPR) repeat protein